MSCGCFEDTTPTILESRETRLRSGLVEMDPCTMLDAEYNVGKP